MRKDLAKFYSASARMLNSKPDVSVKKGNELFVWCINLQRTFFEVDKRKVVAILHA